MECQSWETGLHLKQSGLEDPTAQVIVEYRLGGGEGASHAGIRGGTF